MAFYEVMLSVDVNKLDAFICKYKNDSIEAISVFASGLKKDYDAVKNSLIYQQISNGPMVITSRLLFPVKHLDNGFLLKTQVFLSLLTGNNNSVHISYLIRDLSRFITSASFQTGSAFMVSSLKISLLASSTALIIDSEPTMTIYWYDRETDKWYKQMQQNNKAQQLFDLLRVNPYDCSD